MFFWNKFCGIIIFFFILTNVSYAQYQLQAFPSSKKVSLKNVFLSSETLISLDLKNSFLAFYHPKSYRRLDRTQMFLQEENFNATLSSAVPTDFATCDYGFFCRQELKIEKAAHTPIRFRLGSLEQCNYYEGKH